jgi:hypothetical protein
MREEDDGQFKFGERRDPVLTPFFVGALKRRSETYEWFNNLPAVVPFAIAFGLTWIPGLGLAAGVSVGELSSFPPPPPAWQRFVRNQEGDR